MIADSEYNWLKLPLKIFGITELYGRNLLAPSPELSIIAFHRNLSLLNPDFPFTPIMGVLNASLVKLRTSSKVCCKDFQCSFFPMYTIFLVIYYLF